MLLYAVFTLVITFEKEIFALSIKCSLTSCLVGSLFKTEKPLDLVLVLNPFKSVLPYMPLKNPLLNVMVE